MITEQSFKSTNFQKPLIERNKKRFILNQQTEQNVYNLTIDFYDFATTELLDLNKLVDKKLEEN